MKYIVTPLIGLLLALTSLIVAPIGMLFAVWTVRWDTVETAGSYADDPTVPKTVRGDLPWWLSWFATPDERCPGNTFEPTIMAMIAKRGKVFTTYYNLGLRNQMMGLAAALGKPTTGYIDEEPIGYWERRDEAIGDIVWRYSKSLRWFIFVCGWQVYRRLDMTFLAVPVFTVKRLPKGV
jgi:hypothetical protein